MAKIIKIHVFRLKPGAKLAEGILEFCRKNQVKSGVVLSLIGSLSSAEIGYLKKLPGKFIAKKYRGPLELVSGSGTLAQLNQETLLHIHIVIATEKNVIAGHLSEAQIFSTAEVVLAELDTIIHRQKDPYTGLNELK